MGDGHIGPIGCGTTEFCQNLDDATDWQAHHVGITTVEHGGRAKFIVLYGVSAGLVHGGSAGYRRFHLGIGELAHCNVGGHGLGDATTR